MTGAHFIKDNEDRILVMALLQLLPQILSKKRYKVSHYEKSPGGETIVYYMQRPQGPVFRKAAKDIVIDTGLRQHFDYCDYTIIVSEAQWDRFFESSL